MATTDEIQSKALQFLERLHQITSGDPKAYPKISELESALGFAEDEVYDIMPPLEAEGLIKTVNHGLRVGITSAGVSRARVRQSAVPPQAPHNIIIVNGSVNGSPIQQGVQSSVQNLRFDQASKKDSAPSSVRVAQQERIFSNLLPLHSYPPRIYMADTPYRVGSDLLTEMRRLTSKTDAAWVLRQRRILSFHNLWEYPWQHLCNQGTVESFGSEEWAHAQDPNERYLFVQLLRFTMQDALYGKRIGFDQEKKVHYFLPCGKTIARKIPYLSQKNKVTREVIKAYPDAVNPRHYRHYGFKSMFRYIEREWHLEITPTHYYTTDGFRRDPFDEERLKGIKRLEGNGAVLGQLIMWARILCEPAGLFGQDEPVLRFGALPMYLLEGGFNDKEWGQQEAKDKSPGLDPSQQEMEFLEP